MNELENNLVFVSTPEQQIALGLPDVPTMYPPHDFVKLVGRAQLSHDIFAESASAKKGKEQFAHRTQAAIAQSVVVGVLNKVVELGSTYDAAIQLPPVISPETTPSDFEQQVPVTFSPILLTHYTMTAARRISEVRQAQELQLAQEQNPSA